MSPFEDKNRKNLKFASMLKHQINEILQKEISDPRIGFITITSVRVSADRKQVTVLISSLGNETQQSESLKGLNSAAGYIRHILSKKLEMRFAPEIRFVKDENPGNKIDEILNEIKKENEQ